MRLLIGIAVLAIGFALLALRLIGMFGNPIAVDGALILALVFVGTGSYLIGSNRHAAA